MKVDHIINRDDPFGNDAGSNDTIVDQLINTVIKLGNVADDTNDAVRSLSTKCYSNGVYLSNTHIRYVKLRLKRPMYRWLDVDPISTNLDPDVLTQITVIGRNRLAELQNAEIANKIKSLLDNSTVLLTLYD